MPSKARPNGCTGTGWFVLVFAKDSSWITSRSLWTIDVWIYEDSELKTVVRIHEDWTTDCLVKTQPLHKVFLFYPECSQNTNNMNDAPQPPPIHVAVPDMASSSQTAPPQQDASYSRILAALAALQSGMSTMQLTLSSLQQEVHSINLWVEQSQVDIQECLRHHHPSSSDDKDDAPMDASWFSFASLYFETFWLSFW
jgi:hypothetical protein